MRIVWIIHLDPDLQTILEQELEDCIFLCCDLSHCSCKTDTLWGLTSTHSRSPWGMDIGSFWKQNG